MDYSYIIEILPFPFRDMNSRARITARLYSFPTVVPNSMLLPGSGGL